MNRKQHDYLWIAAMVGCSMTSVGCHSKATMATWQPPGISKIPGPAMTQSRSVAFAPITGPEEICLRLESAITNSQPRGGNHLAVIYPADLPNRSMANAEPSTSSVFRTASHRTSNLSPSNGPTMPGQNATKAISPEITALDAARNRNAGLVVQGNIELIDIGDQATSTKPATPNSPGAAMAVLGQYTKKQNSKDERIIVTFEAFDVASGQIVNASTVSLRRSQVEKEHPDVMMLADPVDRLLTGVSREAWSQYAPAIERKEVTLNRPYWSLGSKRIREGNAFAQEGLWQMAEQQWQSAARSHPKNKSAWLNLAVASVAQEDFELARLRLSKAKSWIPSKQYKQTELWIDAQQKAYHRAFGLPDREGGWLNLDPPMAPPSDPNSVATTVDPVDLEDMPWWTAIPFTKPPGWTWGAWLKQPIP